MLPAFVTVKRHGSGGDRAFRELDFPLDSLTFTAAGVGVLLNARALRSLATFRT